MTAPTPWLKYTATDADYAKEAEIMTKLVNHWEDLECAKTLRSLRAKHPLWADLLEATLKAEGVDVERILKLEEPK